MKSPSLTILEGDCIEQLKTLPDESIHCCVTSPPYWGLRDYGVDGQIGLEKTPEEYVAKMVEVFREVRRVLRVDGTCWVNLGSSYASQGGSFDPQDWDNKQSTNRGSAEQVRNPPNGFKPKDMVPTPWMVAMAMQQDGWWLRQDIIWHKPNPMPESVTDRCTKAHEYIFLLSKSATYFFDAEAIKEPSKTEPHAPGWSTQRPTDSGPMERRKADGSSASQWDEPNRVWGNGTRNKRSVWTIPSQAYSEAHFATFPEDLVKPCIFAGTSSGGCCLNCGAPLYRALEIGTLSRFQKQKVETIAWLTTCDCGCADTVPCTVLDPFGGSFTTCQVALELGRNAVGIELNQEYVKLARARCAVTPGLALA